MHLLQGEPTSTPQKMDAVGAWDWGPMLVARHLWRELGLEKILDGMDKAGWSDRALALVANRFCRPSSEHGLARWLETDFVCDREGRRWLPAWRNEAERQASRRPRVAVKDAQLKQWYGTLDRLIAGKEQIEKKLFLNLRNLFSLKVDLVFYDLTSTYFEGHGPELAAHGHSRDGKPRDRQVLVGLVMIDGWPIVHHVFAGNWRDASTVHSVLKDLETRFGLQRIIVVGDRGMVTSDNIEWIRSRDQGYLMGLNRRRRPEIFGYLERATGPWLECPPGIAASEKSVAPKTRVQEVTSDRAGVRVFVVHSEERTAYEQAERQKAMQRVQLQLQALQQRVAKGRLKAPEKIGAAATRILARHHGYRYYDWELKDGQFHYFAHPINLKREQALEGKYLIATEERNLSPIQAVQVYKELSDVERAFRELKDVIQMRPIYHQTSRRVAAHIFVASLAFLLDRALEKKLKAAGLNFSAKEAWQILKTVRLVEIHLGDREHKQSVTSGSGRAAKILNALKIRDLQPGCGRKTAGKVA